MSMSMSAAEAGGMVHTKGLMLWVSWILTGMAVLVFVWSGYMKLTHAPVYVAEWERLGYPVSLLRGMAVLQLTCLTLYLIPRTSVLGVVLLTGYLGGAIASYVRIGDFAGAASANVFQVGTALLAWGGLYLREARLRALLPFRT